MKEKITKENIKQFWSEHKKEIIGGIIIGGTLITGCVLLGKSKKLPSNSAIDSKFDWDKAKTGLDENSKLYVEMLEVIDRIKEGSAVYVPISADEFKAMNNDCNIISCGKGTELMDVKGLIAFGNKIEAES